MNFDELVARLEANIPDEEMQSAACALAAAERPLLQELAGRLANAEAVKTATYWQLHQECGISETLALFLKLAFPSPLTKITEQLDELDTQLNVYDQVMTPIKVWPCNWLADYLGAEKPHSRWNVCITFCGQILAFLGALLLMVLQFIPYDIGLLGLAMAAAVAKHMWFTYIRDHHIDDIPHLQGNIRLLSKMNRCLEAVIQQLQYICQQTLGVEAAAGERKQAVQQEDKAMGIRDWAGNLLGQLDDRESRHCGRPFLRSLTVRQISKFEGAQ